MKPQNLFLSASAGLILFSLIIINTGCKKSSSGNSAGISATVNGAAFVPSNVQGVYYKSNGGYVQITGIQAKAGADSISLDVFVFDSAHVNEPLYFQGAGIDYVNLHTGAWYLGDEITGHGNIMLTSWDTAGRKISGTFNGVAYSGNDSVVITNGAFNSTYIIE